MFRSDFFGSGASVMELDRKFFVKNNYKNHIKVYSAVLSSLEAGLHNLAFSKLKKKSKVSESRTSERELCKAKSFGAEEQRMIFDAKTAAFILSYPGLE